MTGRLLTAAVVVAVVREGGGALGGEPLVVRTPEHRFAHLSGLGYPWRPHYLFQHVPGLSQPLRVHYIDEGPRDAPETLLLLHGTPSWSFLYRKMVPSFLAAGYRVIALDHIGFGRSDKLTNPAAYSHQLHVETVLLLANSLYLQDVTLVLQDFGGPTGVSAMAREPERYRRLVLLNTLLPQGDALSSFSRKNDYTAHFLWRGLVFALGRHLPVDVVFNFASDAPVAALVGGYAAPFPSSLYRAGPASWPLLLPLKEEDPVAREMQRAAAFLSNWRGPALLGYSEEELFTTAGQALLQQVLPQACQVEIPDAGHFLQEDQGPLVALLVIAFIEEGCGPTLHNFVP